jgi:hypothetical protein
MIEVAEKIPISTIMVPLGLSSYEKKALLAFIKALDSHHNPGQSWFYGSRQAQ